MGDGVPTALPGWTLAWADEFDGAAGSPVDPATWRPEVGGHGWGNEELQYYTDSAESMDPGTPALRASRRPTTRARAWRTTSICTRSAGNPTGSVGTWTTSATARSRPADRPGARGHCAMPRAAPVAAAPGWGWPPGDRGRGGARTNGKERDDGPVDPGHVGVCGHAAVHARAGVHRPGAASPQPAGALIAPPTSAAHGPGDPYDLAMEGRDIALVLGLHQDAA
jgi:hypothetical protein